MNADAYSSVCVYVHVDVSVSVCVCLCVFQRSYMCIVQEGRNPSCSFEDGELVFFSSDLALKGPCMALLRGEGTHERGTEPA